MVPFRTQRLSIVGSLFCVAAGGAAHAHPAGGFVDEAQLEIAGTRGGIGDQENLAAEVDGNTAQAAPASSFPLGLAGDWLGLKSRLSRAGVDLTGRYVSETAWNYAGGRQREATETGELGIGAAFDMKRLVGLDATIQATITYRRGLQLDREAGLGTLQEVQEIYGNGRGWRLTQFWYEQRLAEGALAVKLGRTSPGEDFAAFSCDFQNLSFCGSQPGNLVTSYWYNWPVSQWGLRLRGQLGRISVQAAVYEMNPRNLDEAFTIGYFSGATGVLLPLEVGFTSGGAHSGPIGSYKIGGWLNTAPTADVTLDINRRPRILTALPPLQRSSAHGIWVNLEQQLSGRSERGETISGLTVFFNIALADRLTSPIDSQLAAGLMFKGLFQRSGGDALSAGIAHTHVNSRIARADQLAGKPARGSEYALELFYGFRPFSWLELRPNLQWIHHAGGGGASPDIGVAGLKAQLTL